MTIVLFVPLLALVAEQLPDAVQQEIKMLLRGEIAPLGLGIVISVIGLSAIATHFLRGAKSKGQLLLWFGLFAGLYGLREIAGRQVTWLLFDVQAQFWRYVVAFISYVIIIPALLFFERLYGKGWRSSIRWLAWIFSAYAGLAILVALVQRNPFAAPDPGTGLLILLPPALLVGHVLGYRPPKIAEAGAFTAGFLVFILTVLNQHLVSASLVPWRLRVEPLGFLFLICCLGYIAVRRFVSNERQLLAVEEEMKSANRIQAAILPGEIPRLHGLKLAVRYAPMAAVAGDFYSFVEVDKKRLGILVADVTGHGVPAALVASMIKVAISTQAANASHPATVISGLNQMMCQEVRGQLASAGYLFLDAEARTAFYAAAGHPPLLFWQRANRTVREFRESGVLLGVRPVEEYVNCKFGFQPGDRILLYTDGIVEATNSSEEFFGEERLREFIVTHEGLPADPFAEALLQEVMLWSGSTARGVQEDDLTFIVADIEA